MDDRRAATCETCGREHDFDVIGDAGKCPSCGGARFFVDLESQDDIELFAAHAEIRVESHLCLTWARIAIDAAQRAVHAASSDIDVEFGEALLACTAAAHAVDAFYGGFTQFVARPRQLASRSSRDAVVLETAKAAFKIGRDARTFAPDLQWLYRLRDGAVHFGEESHPPAEHASGRLTSHEVARWSAPAAQRAVELMLRFMVACVSHPKDHLQLAAWSKGIRRVLASFEARWTA